MAELAPCEHRLGPRPERLIGEPGTRDGGGKGQRRWVEPGNGRAGEARKERVGARKD